jgi:hypothetical protein
VIIPKLRGCIPRPKTSARLSIAKVSHIGWDALPEALAAGKIRVDRTGHGSQDPGLAPFFSAHFLFSIARIVRVALVAFQTLTRTEKLQGLLKAGLEPVDETGREP